MVKYFSSLNSDPEESKIWILLTLRSGNIYSAHKYPFPEGIFVKDEEKQGPVAYLHVVLVFCFPLKNKKKTWPRPKRSFWKTFKCQTAVVTQAISNTGFVNSLYWWGMLPEVLRKWWNICHLSLDYS